MTIPSKKSLRNIGTAFKVLSWFLGVLLFTIACVRWSSAQPLTWFPPSFSYQYKISNFTISMKLLGFSIEMIPFFCQVCILKNLIKIGNIYQEGNLLHNGTGTIIRKLGTSIFFLSVANIFYSTATDALFAYIVTNNHLKISIGLSTSELYLFITSLVIFSLGHLVQEGERLKQENSEII